MNPSSSGWITKLGRLLTSTPAPYSDFQMIYDHLVPTGFVYGISVKPFIEINSSYPFTEDELAKINLVTALYYSYIAKHPEGGFDQFIQTLFEFYEALGFDQLNFFEKIFTPKKTAHQLELLIDKRIYVKDGPFYKFLGANLTNSLLIIDLMSFNRYLDNSKGVVPYTKALEQVTLHVALETLGAKSKDRKHQNLMYLLEQSLTYDNEGKKLDQHQLEQKVNEFFEFKEKRYLMDMASLAVWEDGDLEYSEHEQLTSLAARLNLETVDVKNAQYQVIQFFTAHLGNVKFLKDTNLSQRYYDNITKNVQKLILRNQKRITKELQESKELFQLLTKSATTELSQEEKHKLKNQLFDLFKTIPSLAIFMLPGGAILLPIFIKLIPKLLPSAFDENRVEDKL